MGIAPAMGKGSGREGRHAGSDTPARSIGTYCKAHASKQHQTDSKHEQP